MLPYDFVYVFLGDWPVPNNTKEGHDDNRDSQGITARWEYFYSIFIFFGFRIPEFII